MLIKSSDELPRKTLFKRFPIPRNAQVPPEFRIQPGKVWPEPEGAESVKRLRIFRYNLENGKPPQIDIFTIDRDDCGPMLLDALLKIKAEIDSTLTFRRSCREGFAALAR